MTPLPRRREERPTAPKVSVLIKSYNHAKYVARTLASVLEQTFQDFEIIVTDDGSTDGTAEIIAGCADPRLDLEAWPQNRGLSTAMNGCIARARGEYLAILNSDDFALSTRFERQVAHLDANPHAAAVFTLPLAVGEDGETLPDIWIFQPSLSFKDFTTPTWLRWFFLAGNCLCAPTAMVRRTAYAGAGAYDPRFTNLQDLDMWVRMTGQGELHVLPEKLTAFRIRDGNANLSAPRPDSLLRHQFEYYRILMGYLDLDRETLLAAFGKDLARHGIDPGLEQRRWLAELALKAGPYSPHKLFAVQALFESARTDADYIRLREVAGAIDLFGIQANTKR